MGYLWMAGDIQVILLLLPPHYMANKSSYSLLKSNKKTRGKIWSTASARNKVQFM